MTSKISDYIVDLKHNEVLSEVKSRLEQGEDPMSIVDDCKKALITVGENYKKEEIFLAELMLSGEIFKEVMDLITPYLISNSKKNVKGKILLATIQGDIHDLGKNLFGTLLKINGFDVYDLGVDVDPKILLDKVREIKPDFIGFSALLTTTFEPMKKVIDKLAEDNLRDSLKILVGGGVTTSLVKDYVGADFQSIDAMEGVEYCLKNTKQEGTA